MLDHLSNLPTTGHPDPPLEPQPGEIRDPLLPMFARQAAALGALKRTRAAHLSSSVAGQLFQSAWAALLGDSPAGPLSAAIAAEALVATQLGAINGQLLRDAGCAQAEADAVVARALEAACAGLPRHVESRLAQRLGAGALRPDACPSFVPALMGQPRAGATAPGYARLILEPAESHADHCLVVAVLGALLAERFGADAGTVFVAGLAHHLHNARLPDSGFAGEMLLGGSLPGIMRRLFDAELAQLPKSLAGTVRSALAATADAATPEGRAFHTADVFDRVAQVRHYEQVAAFSARQALEDLDLVHAGPLQAFQKDMLHQGGLI